MTETLTLLTLGILPSLIWLFYFLEKDKEPEPRLMILLVFIFGITGAGIAAMIQEPLRTYIYSIDTANFSNLELVLISLFDSFFAVSLLEETAKFLAFFVAGFIFIRRELDEPVDFIIYMITAGLGFAALENYYYFSMATSEIMAELIFLRFAITTFFHAIVAGILGYFIALSVRDKSYYIVVLGLIVVSFMHTLYNILIQLMTTSHDLIYPGLLLAFLFILSAVLLRGFKETKQMESICR